MKHPIELGSVQETLLATLYSRAALTKKDIGGLRDDTAVRIVESIDYDFTRFDSRAVIAPALRTAMFDRWVRQFLREHPDGTVIEIGAGLNSRFERVDNGRVRWFDVDLADTMELRRKFFADTDRHTQVVGSIIEEDWIPDVSGPVFLIAEGVYPYLSAEEVERSVRLLGKRFPGARFGFDTIAPFVVEHQARTELLKALPATLTWGVDDPRDVERWGLRLIEKRTYSQIPADLDPPLASRHRFMFRMIGVIGTLMRAKVVKSASINLFELSR